MDPLTHTLVGANLAATRLGRTTPLATAALVLGANAPDIDVLAYAVGPDFAFGFRRGWTHGLLSLAILPLLVTGLLLLWDRLVRRNAAQRARWPTLLWLSFLAILTHPFLDWLNNYGMRWLMPWDGTWFYGDAVFIMDPWLWLTLGIGWLLGRRPSLALFTAWGVFSALIVAVVWMRSPLFVPAVLAVAGGLLLALLWRPDRDRELRLRGRLAGAGLLAAGAFIAGMIGLQTVTANRVQAALIEQGAAPVQRMLVGPVPINPLIWSVVAELPEHYRFGSYRWLDGGLQLEADTIPVPQEGPLWAAARSDPTVSGFMTWVRFPWYVVEPTPEGTLVHIMDARYTQTRTAGFGSTSVLVERGAAE